MLLVSVSVRHLQLPFHDKNALPRHVGTDPLHSNDDGSQFNFCCPFKTNPPSHEKTTTSPPLNGESKVERIDPYSGSSSSSQDKTKIVNN